MLEENTTVKEETKNEVNTELENNEEVKTELKVESSETGENLEEKKDDIPASTETTEKENADSSKGKKLIPEDKVNSIVKKRLAENNNKLYSSLGVNNKEDLEKAVSKAQSYDVLEKENNDLKVELKTLKEEKAFKDNKVEPSRYDDIRAYFKGKELELTEDALIESLKTHPEWVIKEENSKKENIDEAILKVLGNPSGEEPIRPDDKTRILRDYFNMDIK